MFSEQRIFDSETTVANASDLKIFEFIIFSKINFIIHTFKKIPAPDDPASFYIDFLYRLGQLEYGTESV